MDEADQTNSPPVGTFIKLSDLANNKYNKKHGINGPQALSMSLLAGGGDIHPLVETTEKGKTNYGAACAAKALEAVAKSAPTAAEELKINLA